MYKDSREYIYRGVIAVLESAYTQAEITLPQNDTGETDEYH